MNSLKALSVVLLTILFGAQSVFSKFVLPVNSCDYLEMTPILQQFASNYTHLCRLISIGRSVEGREIWGMILSDSPQLRPLLRPQVKFVGNINGFSGSACYLLMRFIQHMLESFESEGSFERKLLESNEIHVIPNMNPDGYSRTISGSCEMGHGRHNANGVSLNKDFPNIFAEHTDNQPLPLQNETSAVIKWSLENKFVLSLSFISGAKVVSFPFDGIPSQDERQIEGEPHLTPDHEIFDHLALSYAQWVWGSNPSAWFCPLLHRNFSRGVINGAEWSPQAGTMMDYNYIELGTFELMVGVSCCRNEMKPDQLDQIWHEHSQGMLKMIGETETGVRGQVIDTETYMPLEGAMLVRVQGEGSYPVPWYTSPQGEFWRPLLPGKHSLKVMAHGYDEKVVSFEVTLKEHTFLLIELDKTQPEANILPVTETKFTPTTTDPLTTTETIINIATQKNQKQRRNTRKLSDDNNDHPTMENKLNKTKKSVESSQTIEESLAKVILYAAFRSSTSCTCSPSDFIHVFQLIVLSVQFLF